MLTGLDFSTQDRFQCPAFHLCGPYRTNELLVQLLLTTMVHCLFRDPRTTRSEFGIHGPERRFWVHWRVTWTLFGLFVGKALSSQALPTTLQFAFGAVNRAQPWLSSAAIRSQSKFSRLLYYLSPMR
jgi:hypothetical protein